MAVRTYAPCRQTPILRVKLTRDHLSHELRNEMVEELNLS